LPTFLIKRGTPIGTPFLKKGTPYLKIQTITKNTLNMNNNKLTVLFLLQKTRINKRGECSIRCRLTFFKKRKIFSTGLFINPDHWNSKKQTAIIPDDNFINNQLSLIKQKVNQAFLFLQVNSKNFDAGDVYLQFKGESTK